MPASAEPAAPPTRERGSEPREGLGDRAGRSDAVDHRVGGCERRGEGRPRDEERDPERDEVARGDGRGDVAAGERGEDERQADCSPGAAAEAGGEDSTGQGPTLQMPSKRPPPALLPSDEAADAAPTSTAPTSTPTATKTSTSVCTAAARRAPRGRADVAVGRQARD